MPKVEFIQYHQPAMESGTYRIRVEQVVSTKSNTIPSAQTYSREVAFAVTGERFSTLDASDVSAVFPPDASLGDHNNVLAHISLTRSTLPWERAPDEQDLGLPWLALLVLRDSDFPTLDDKPQPQIITLSQLQSTPASTARYPAFELEPSQAPTDKVTVIDVKKGLLSQLLPLKSELAYLSHVRQPLDDSGNLAGEEIATVIANRLPQNGGSSTAYLISLEGRYPSGGDTFDFQNAGDDDKIRLVVLRHFQFSCLDDKQSFSQLLLNLAHDTFRLANSSNADANAALATGSVALRHRLREGDKTVSWYHGPFRPGQTTDLLNLPVRDADELYRYDQGTGMFDASYAAAWELGRLLTLRNQGVALALYDWKQGQAQNIKAAEQAVEHLPLTAPETDSQVPPTISTWFSDLSLLKNVPFNYLVPDERFLPIESIRFFRVDARWVECLLDGAFSIGRVTDGDVAQDAENPLATPYGNLSGFLMRSDVVSGWPNLLVDGYSQVIDNADFVPDAVQPLPIVRMERLSSNVLLCLFDGDVRTVDIHQKPEAMHFGVDAATGNPPQYHKTLRDLTTGDELSNPLPIPWRNEQLGVVDIGSLANAMKGRLGGSGFTSAQFALEMIEGVEKVRFISTGS
ncbi:hypothetical protein JRI60_23310 [Archangium violaceum]|uniref:hypothetical protein n=1 Tax=Archangium violaceum TaxID=83451 RepID=UPI00194E2DBB|nr:hypothetical protein [Archangium violaceum]QRO01742.1 hypothetical protein JRI60_23310 [Archangium violaceum]